ncbi:hypothetical protein DPMN_192981 [Dreissena polymorpha]|uniref:Uncharacterized protein n=1 Tax=Dreissena polymorpha TaxID=45954 RepID=A0A9D4B6V5_DREPO|nr:hypothetical protein DPMN_192981 [Dreissena polymorpha]
MFKPLSDPHQTEYKRLPPPHADCGTSGQGVVDMYARDFGTAYTKETCLKSCIQAALLDQCACATSIFYVPPGEKVCSMSGNDCKFNVLNQPTLVLHRAGVVYLVSKPDRNVLYITMHSVFLN